MVIEKVQVLARKPLDLGEGVVHELGVEVLPAGEEGILVAEIAVMGAAARDHSRVGHEVEVALDELTADRGNPHEGAGHRRVARLRCARLKVLEKLRPDILTGTEEDRVGVGRGFVGERRHVQASQADKRPPCPVVVGQGVGPPRRRDIDLDRDDIGRVVEVQRLHVIVFEARVPVVGEIRGQCRQPQRWEEAVLDGPEERGLRFGERGEDKLDVHLIIQSTLYYKV